MLQFFRKRTRLVDCVIVQNNFSNIIEQRQCIEGGQAVVAEIQIVDTVMVQIDYSFRYLIQFLVNEDELEIYEYLFDYIANLDCVRRR
jgi:hypothetical protein